MRSMRGVGTSLGSKPKSKGPRAPLIFVRRILDALPMLAHHGREPGSSESLFPEGCFVRVGVEKSVKMDVRIAMKLRQGYAGLQPLNCRDRVAQHSALDKPYTDGLSLRIRGRCLWLEEQGRACRAGRPLGPSQVDFRRFLDSRLLL